MKYDAKLNGDIEQIQELFEQMPNGKFITDEIDRDEIAEHFYIMPKGIKEFEDDL